MPSDSVVLLHGLGRRAASLARMRSALTAEGYRVFALDYPSTRHDLPTLTALLRPKVAEIAGATAGALSVSATVTGRAGVEGTADLAFAIRNAPTLSLPAAGTVVAGRQVVSGSRAARLAASSDSSGLVALSIDGRAITNAVESGGIRGNLDVVNKLVAGTDAGISHQPSHRGASPA